MESILFKIQDTVIDYANVISNITHVDVEVMDKNFRRVAGTGVFKKRINENMENESFIYQKVLESGEVAIVNNPRIDEICTNCPTKKTCSETFEISAPIKLDDETIGVIGMISNDEKAKDVITENLNDYLKLLAQISDFIAAKAYEFGDMERLMETVT
ncbi:MAG: AAA family ATPase, partial [Tissierellia bacterium]|nr:AAA family ATPase [Tissierellia bacterium]